MATDLKTVTLWLSYVGEGAPSNAAGTRVGLGATEEQARDAAGHWANQAPWARARQVTLIDRAAPGLVDGEHDFAVEREIEALLLSPRKEDLAMADAAFLHLEAGRVASAWLAMHRDIAGYEEGRRYAERAEASEIRERAGGYDVRKKA